MHRGPAALGRVPTVIPAGLTADRDRRESGRHRFHVERRSNYRGCGLAHARSDGPPGAVLPPYPNSGTGRAEGHAARLTPLFTLGDWPSWQVCRRRSRQGADSRWPGAPSSQGAIQSLTDAAQSNVRKDLKLRPQAPAIAPHWISLFCAFWPPCSDTMSQAERGLDQTRRTATWPPNRATG